MAVRIVNAKEFKIALWQWLVAASLLYIGVQFLLRREWVGLVMLGQVYFALTAHRKNAWEKVAEVCADDRLLSVVRASGEKMEIPMDSVEFAEHFRNSVFICYRGNEELHRMELERRFFDPDSWAQVGKLADALDQGRRDFSLA